MNQLPIKFSAKPTLHYPFELRWSPEPGEPFEVAEGVYWLRMPLPIALDHINLWLLRDGDGWTIVDSGFDDQSCKDVWEKVFDSFIEPLSVKRIIVTHFHPDHIGLASWLAHRCECPILISKGEFDHYQQILTRTPKSVEREVSSYVQELGFDEKYKQIFTAFFKNDEKPDKARVQEPMCRFLKEADQITINGRVWRVLIGNGHSPEHVCLVCDDLNLTISGDQSIPRISSNVSVYPSNRDKDPLGDWLSSCAKLRDNIPVGMLVLPSHQEPFTGNELRMQQMIDDHHIQLDCLRATLAKPHTVVQARGILFNRELNTIDTLLATGETLAHLNYLIHRNEIQVEHDNDGVAYYQTTALCLEKTA